MQILQLIGSGLAGVAGWLIASFVGAPFIQFMELRRRIATARLRALNTPVNLKPLFTKTIDAETQKDIDRLEAAKDQLREAAIEIEAFGQATPVARVLKLFGFDPREISNAAASYANSLDGPIVRRAENDRVLVQALKIRR